MEARFGQKAARPARHLATKLQVKRAHPLQLAGVPSDQQGLTTGSGTPGPTKALCEFVALLEPCGFPVERFPIIAMTVNE